MNYIFLDDERVPSDVTWLNLPKVNWVIVRDPETLFSVVNALGVENCVFSFDHDIQHDLTGYDCLKRLVNDYFIDVKYDKDIYLHTKNPVGKHNMKEYYLGYLRYIREG